MLTKLFLLFIVVPLVELALLLLIAEHTGWEFSLLLVIATGIVGACLARMQGWQVWRRIHHQMAEGQMPADALLDAMMIFVAGAFLLTPGVLTDVVGLTLLVPPARRIWRNWLVTWFQSKFTVYSRQPPQGSGDQIVDSYVVDRKDEEVPD